MAMNLGYKTKQLILGETDNIRLSNETYDDLIATNGEPQGTVYNSSSDAGHTILENEYIDMGIITNESEDLSAGGIALSIPTGGAGSRMNWAVGGRVLRINLSGIIPDGTYVVKSGDPDHAVLSGKSNSAVFRYKVNRFFAYASLFSASDRKLRPNTVQYRRYYINEKVYTAGPWSKAKSSEVGSWVCTNYNISLVEGTRHLQYTLTLDFANDFGDLNPGEVDGSSFKEGIQPRPPGEL